MSPFYALYGQECRTPISLATLNSKIESLNQMIHEMHVYWNVISSVCKVHKRNLNSMPTKRYKRV
jgi:hypothetical protein